MKKTAIEIKRENIVDEIKNVISRMGISQKEAADIIAEKLGQDNFYDRFKKQLGRSSTKIQHLENYLLILKESESYVKAIGFQAKQSGDVDILGEAKRRNLHKLSKMIAEYIDNEKIDSE